MQQELQAKEQAQPARAANLEERVQEQEQERKQLRQQLEEQREKMRQMHEGESKSSVSSPPPDDRILLGKPVVSIDGNNVFGKFKGWSTERDKVGILVEDPKDSSKYQKVGWGNNIRELVVDPGSLRHKDVIITKIDSNGDMSDYVSVHQHKEEVQRARRLEEKANRLGSENRELQDMVNKLERTNNKLLTQLSVQQMRNRGTDGQKDLEMSRLRKERDIDKQRMENLNLESRHKKGRVQETIDKYEQEIDQTFGHLGKDTTEQSVEEVGQLVQALFGELGLALDQLSQEQQEDLLQSITGGGSGGAINIKEES
jgi:predicted RNase H-like nuclease (RuvC/YqgF family)